MNYSRGTWKAIKWEDGYYYIIDGDTNTVASLGNKIEPCIYNAPLIVAAVNSCIELCPDNPLAAAEAYPEVVQALKSILPLVSDCGGDWCFLATEGTEYEVPEPDELIGTCKYSGLCRMFARWDYTIKQALNKVEGK